MTQKIGTPGMEKFIAYGYQYSRYNGAKKTLYNNNGVGIANLNFMEQTMIRLQYLSI